MKATCLPQQFIICFARCNQCQPLYNNKPYRDGDGSNEYPCKRCECHDHADSCVYDVTFDPFPNSHDQGGGGVCQNCRHNTQGQRCDECVANFFRPVDRDMRAENVCEACACFAPGTLTSAGPCEPVGGQCLCRSNVEGVYTTFSR